MIDLKKAREEYNHGRIDDITWIRRKFNFVDPMTKAIMLTEFLKASEKTQSHYEVEQSGNRTISSSPTNEKEKIRGQQFHGGIPSIIIPNIV